MNIYIIFSKNYINNHF